MININLPPDFQSDGCSFPGILKVLKLLLGGDRYHEYCREHDFLRRHGVINGFMANWLLGKRIASDGIVGKLRAPFYVMFTTLSYPFYGSGDYLPEKWEKYREYYE